MADLAPTSAEGGGRFHRVRDELAQLLTLSGPVVLARLGIMTMGLSDAIVVGRYAASELGYHAMAWAPTSVVLTVAIGALTGVQVMTSRAIGAGRAEDTGAVLRRGLSYSLWLGLASMFLMVVLGPWSLRHMGLEPDLAAGAAKAVVIFALSLPTYVVACAAISWLEAHARPTPPMLMMWGANVVNLGLLLWLVPGTSGLGISGAIAGAWSTFGARAFLLIALAVYILRMKEARAYGVFDKPVPDRALEAEQRQVGYGAGASNFFEVAAFASMNVIAGWLGGAMVAAWAIVLNVAAMVFMVPLGLATGTAVMVGRAYGARDAKGVVRVGLIGFGVATAFGVVISLIVWPTAHWIAAAYTRDPMVIEVAASAMILCCLFFLADALQVVVAQALRARGDVWVPSATHLTSYVAVMMPLAWWLAIPMGMGLHGIVWAVIAASLLSAGLLLARFWQLSQRD